MKQPIDLDQKSITLEDISIHMANPADIPSIARDLVIDPIIAKNISRYVHDETYTVIAANTKGHYIGSVILSRVAIHEQLFRKLMPKVPVVYSLFVHKDYVRRGIGTKLMDRLESLAAQNGYSQLLLGVTPDNSKARAMYEQRGYTYMQLNEDKTVKSNWETTGPDGDTVYVTVDVMPMVKVLN